MEGWQRGQLRGPAKSESSGARRFESFTFLHQRKGRHDVSTNGETDSEDANVSALSTECSFGPQPGRRPAHTDDDPWENQTINLTSIYPLCYARRIEQERSKVTCRCRLMVDLYLGKIADPVRIWTVAPTYWSCSLVDCAILTKWTR